MVDDEVDNMVDIDVIDEVVDDEVVMLYICDELDALDNEIADDVVVHLVELEVVELVCVVVEFEVMLVVDMVDIDENENVSVYLELINGMLDEVDEVVV